MNKNTPKFQFSNVVERLTDNGQGIECVTDASIIGDAIKMIGA